MSNLSNSSNREIPNAFLIRALARNSSEHCEGCGGRMFVQTVTGKCPYCRAGYPPPTVARTAEGSPPLPFAPRVGERVILDGLLSRLLSGLLAFWARRQRRAAESRGLALRAGHRPHAHAAAG